MYSELVMKPEMITYVYYSASVAFFIYVSCASILKNKKRALECGLLFSPLCAIILICSDFVCGAAVSRYAVLSAACATMPLIICDCMKDKKRMKTLNAVFFCVCFIVTAAKILFPAYMYKIIMYVISLVLVLFIPCAKFALLNRKFFTHAKDSIPEGISADVSSLYSSCFTAALLFSELPLTSTGIRYKIVHSVISMAMMLAIYLCLYIRLFEDRLFVILRKKEDEIQQKQKLRIQEHVRSEANDEFSYKAIFDRMEAYFESENPFLDENVNIADIAKKIYTNKAYLSRAINMYTGRNFCQYVNYHRVRYSLKLFESDPTMKISELAGMSGFHTPASYNMAFRLYMNETPGDWCRKFRLRNLDSGNGK